MRHIDLFSGIGGFPLAASWVWPDHEPVAFCEREPYCRRILRHHWPEVPIIDDVHDFNGTDYAAIDLLTGGFPCQPYSSAGQRRGTADDRHLWPEMLRVIREAQPRFVVGENVYGLLTWNRGVVFGQVLSDLENAGYEVLPVVCPAAGTNAPHRRDRVWIVARCRDVPYPEGVGWRNGPTFDVGRPDVEGDALGDGGGILADTDRQRLKEGGELYAGDGAGLDPRRQDATDSAFFMLNGAGGAGPRRRFESSNRRRHASDADRERQQERHAAPIAGFAELHAGRSLPAWAGGRWNAPEPAVRAMDDGFPERVAGLRALGNAIVPQVAAEIFRAIKASDGG